MSALSESEREALLLAIYPDGYSHPFNRENQVVDVVEAILTARLAPIEALCLCSSAGCPCGGDRAAVTVDELRAVLHDPHGVTG